MSTSYGYKKLNELFRDASKELTYPVGYDSGIVSDINIFNKEHNATLLWLVPPAWNGQLTNRRRILKTYTVIFYVYQQDKLDSSNEDRDRILDNCDFIATEYFIRLNQHFEENETREFDISGLSATPIIKTGTEIFTGLECRFTLGIPDDNPYCE